MIKYGLLDPKLMQKMRERLFAGSEEFGGRITADDPSSWVGPLLPEEECVQSLAFTWLGQEALISPRLNFRYSGPCARAHMS